MFYAQKGNGQPLILIPGFTSGSWIWFCQIEELSKDFQVITFDPRGIGQSPSDLPNPSLETFAADVGLILDELKIKKAHVLGASFGGFIALELALKFPERVKKLVLACTSAGGKNHVKPDIEILRSFTRNPQMSPSEQIRHFFRPAFTEKFHAEHPEMVEKVCLLRQKNEVAEEVYAAQLNVAFSFDFEENLGKIPHQTLVITGNQDKIVPMENSINLAEKLPNAQLKVIENGSHMIFIENAAEFNQAVRQFLR